jgi:lipid II:glycine glycyltransferase (peptidoglycan interpeptide bridge formation enzyme)
VRLYAKLVERHNLRGIKAFSRNAFALQFEVPGLMAFRATRNGRTIGMHLWYLQSSIAYSHLSAFDDEGYSLRAAYALHWHAIQQFKRYRTRNVRWIDLGAGAGVDEAEDDGLTTFKRGWATAHRMKYFCGVTFDPEAYALLSAANKGRSSYFPLYRMGELS